ncbi:MAG: TIGR03986 family type III CRISPR-associated RAMP protein [Blastocatellia bacterium]
MFKGIIAELRQGFGFINGANNGKEHQRLFFGRSGMAPSLSFTDLAVGTQVEYETEPSEKGGLRAVNVRISDTTTSAGQSMPAPVTASGPVEYKFLNPYNFIRFLPVPGRTELAAEQQLLSRCAPPPHDRYVGLTGEIACSLKNVTPLFISDPKVVAENEHGHKSYRFFQVNGQYAIPATALRGVARSVFEAATNSCLMIFEGQRLSRHLPTNEGRELWPARVVPVNGKLHLEIEEGTTTFNVNGPPMSKLLPAAWIMQYRYGVLQASPTASYPPNRSTPYALRTPVALPAGLKHGGECWALIEPMQRPSRKNKKGKIIAGFDFWNVLQIGLKESDVPAPVGNQRRVQGWFCKTNHNIENKHDERIFFTAGNLPTVEIPERVLKDYRDLIKDYQERHRDQVNKLRQDGIDPAKPHGKEAGYSRFILETRSELRAGDLVYAKFEATKHAMIVRFIAPVSMPRISYEKSIAKIVEEQHPHLRACTKYEELCPACRVFGWVHQKPPKELERVAYAGRVRFSHAKLEGEPRLLGEETLAILSSPKPTTTKFYLLDGQRPSTNVDYDSPNAQLRGRKFYRHHGVANPQEYRRATDAEHDGRDNQNRTVIDALDKDNVFTFTVQFENLAPVELGALLWALELDGQGVQRLGFAKPLGFGSAEIKVTSLRVLDPAARYSSLAAGWVDATAQRTQCVEQFKTALRSLYDKASFEALENITDLRRLLRPPTRNLLVHYPRTTQEPEPEGKQYEWFMNSERQHELPLPEFDTDGLPLVSSLTRRR